ncbi:MAG: histidine phosphatase family protein [Actinomycetota bacterium]|nr:histidine phosphatase family protein [Actinomycetota bacterium]
MIIFVRHAAVLVDRDAPASSWTLDHEAAAACAPLREWLTGRDLRWLSSPEHKATATLQLLTDRPYNVVPELAEVSRAGWLDDYRDAVAKFFAARSSPSLPGWETADAAAARFDRALRDWVGGSSGDGIVVGTHGLVLTAWACRDKPADKALKWWAALTMPALLVMDDPDTERWLTYGEARVSDPLIGR